MIYVIATVEVMPGRREQFLDEFRRLRSAADRAGTTIVLGGRGLTPEITPALGETIVVSGMQPLRAFARAWSAAENSSAPKSEDVASGPES